MATSCFDSFHSEDSSLSSGSDLNLRRNLSFSEDSDLSCDDVLERSSQKSKADVSTSVSVESPPHVSLAFDLNEKEAERGYSFVSLRHPYVRCFIIFSENCVLKCVSHSRVLKGLQELFNLLN